MDFLRLSGRLVAVHLSNKAIRAEATIRDSRRTAQRSPHNIYIDSAPFSNAPVFARRSASDQANTCGGQGPLLVTSGGQMGSASSRSSGNCATGRINLSGPALGDGLADMAIVHQWGAVAGQAADGRPRNDRAAADGPTRSR